MATQEELAKYLYIEWRTHMDRLEPVPEMVIVNDDGRKEVPNGRVKPRPRWDALTSQQQSVWMACADVALRVGTAA